MGVSSDGSAVVVGKASATIQTDGCCADLSSVGKKQQKQISLNKYINSK